MAPLYLGADLLSNTDIRTENHPRYHAKFAKKGLATKIHFSSGKKRIVPYTTELLHSFALRRHLIMLSPHFDCSSIQVPWVEGTYCK